MKIAQKVKKHAWGKVVDLILQIVDIGTARGFLIKKAEKKLWQEIVEENKEGLRPAQELKFFFVKNLLYTTDHHLRRGMMSKDVFHKMVKVFVRNVFIEDISERDLRKIEGTDAVYPCYLVLSPTQSCNLRCPGCYASSGSHTRTSLPWEIVTRIIKEKKEFWHSRFTVISGGEPFLWHDKGKGIIDLAREHDDNFFMVYTNGTLIDREVAKRLAEVGNLTPCISVEGFEQKTDERRGRGVSKKIMEAFEYLRGAGVPFGISVEATKDNWDEVTSKEFLKFYFDEQGVFYGWLFQYMPIGRGYTLEKMVTPEQRLEMFKRNVWAIKEGYNYIDFWNQGVMTDGTRLRIMMLLTNGELCVCDLMEVLGEPQSKISRHLAYLKHSGITENKRVGVWMHYWLRDTQNGIFKAQIEFLKEKLSEMPQFQIDRQKLIELKRKGSCKAIMKLKSTRKSNK